MTCGFASPEEIERMRVMTEEALNKAYYHAGIIPGRGEGEAQDDGNGRHSDSVRTGKTTSSVKEHTTEIPTLSHAGSNPAPKQPKPRPIIRRCVQEGKSDTVGSSLREQAALSNEVINTAPGQDKELPKAKKVGLGILNYIGGDRNGNK
jgi:hypothetical protein